MGMGRWAVVTIAVVLGLSLAVARVAGQTRGAATSDGAAATSRTADSHAVTEPATAAVSTAPATETRAAATSPAAPSDQGRKVIDLPLGNAPDGTFVTLASGFTISADGIYAAVPVDCQTAAGQPGDKPVHRTDVYLVDMALMKLVALSDKLPAKAVDAARAGDSTTKPEDATTMPGDTTTRPADSTTRPAGLTMQVSSPQFSPDNKYMTFQTVSGDDRRVSLWLMDLTSPGTLEKRPAQGKTISCLAEGKTLMTSWVGKKIALGTTDKLGYFQPIKFFSASTLASDEWPVRGYVASADSKGELIVCTCMVNNPRGPANSDELSKLSVVLMKSSGKIVKKLSTAGEVSSRPIFSPSLKYVAYQRNKRKSTGRVMMDAEAIEVVALEGDYTRTITAPELAIHVTDGGSLFSLGTGPAGTSGVVKMRDKSGKPSVLFEAVSASVANNTIYYIKTSDSGSAIMSVPLPKE
jgi:hypothetical protein